MIKFVKSGDKNSEVKPKSKTTNKVTSTIIKIKTLKEVDLKEPVDLGRGFIAAHLGKIRLIDNLDMS